MYKNLLRILFTLLLFTIPLCILAQQTPRIQGIQRKLDSLGRAIPGLNQKVSLQVNGTIQQYLAGIASSNGVSISVDPKLVFNVNDNLTEVTATNILVFLAEKYNLDVSVVGSIIYVTQYQDPAQFIKPPIKEINATYNAISNTLSFSLDNDSLTGVARKITQISGKNVVVPTVLLGKKVSGFISNAPFDGALEKLAYTNEIKTVKTNDNFYLFQPLEEDEELYVNGDKNTSTRHIFKPAAPGAGGGVTNGVYSRMVGGQKVISADATNAPILNLIKQASQEAGKNYSLYSDIKGNIDIHVHDIPFDEFMDLLFKGTDYTYQSENGIYLIGDRKLQGLRTFKMIQLQSRAIDTIVSLIPVEWKKGIEIKEFREQNTILLSGSIAQIREVENFIKQLDVLVPVVLIEVTLIDFHKTNTIATGISAGVSDSVKTGGTVLPGVNFTASASSINSFLNSLGKLTSINLGHVVPNFYATIQALESNNNVDVRSVPKLSVINGHSATMSIGSKLYYKNTTQNLIPSASTNTSIFSNIYVPVEANLSLDLKPVVSGDDQVTLGIRVNISDFTSIPTDGSPPPQSISKFETSLRVHSGDTILLGGIERTEHDLTTSGVPLLSRIPILKWIFSSRTKTASKVITVLFIKSTILH